MVDSGIPRNVLVAGVVLWGLVFVLAGALVVPTLVSTISGVATAGDAGDNGPDAETASANDSAVTVRESENVSMRVGNDSGIDIVVDLGAFQTRVQTGGADSDRATVSMQSGAIDEAVERDGNAGLCAIGFDSASAPLTISLDGENGSVNATMTAAPNPDGADARADPQSVVSACRTR